VQNASSNGAGQSTAARIASKAKGPALAGGAALVGLAGGAALNRNRNRGLRGKMSKLGPPKLGTPKLSAPKLKTPKVNTSKLKSKVPNQMPRPDAAVRAVGSAAGEVARRSSRIGQIASEVQKASEAIDDRSKGSS